VSGERELIIDLMVIIAAAAAGGFLASLLRLPVVLGYLLAGLVVSSRTPGWDVDIENVQIVAELGVALLLFTLGIQFSFAHLADVRRVALVGGFLQISLTIVVGLVLGLGLGFDIEAALLLGAVVSLSSSMVALKLLDARGELDSLHGRVAIGLLLVQDIAVVPMVILVPAIAGEAGSALALELLFAAGKAAALLLVVFLLANLVVPRLLRQTASTGSSELLLLAVLSIAMSLAGVSFLLGFSLAFGAFLAGLVVSESEFSHQALADVLPMREIFATIFFVSMGMLIDPAVVVDDPGRVAAISVTIVIAKLFLTAAPVAALGYPAATAVLSGLALAQAGEFSFVLTQVGVEENVISDDLASTILMAVLVSIVISPLLLQTGPTLIAKVPLLSRLLQEPLRVDLAGEGGDIRRHVIVCGYGRIGRELVDEIVQREFRCVVIERDPYRFDDLRRLGIPAIYGDAARLPVLDAAGLSNARVLAVTLPDPATAEVIVRHAKRANSRLDAIVRGRGRDDHQALLEAGAIEVVHPELESALEFVRHTLQRFGVDRTQIQLILARRRRDLYV
jgi:CPA2 family monovalent cation:H+ antiporter-2